MYKKKRKSARHLNISLFDWCCFCYENHINRTSSTSNNNYTGFPPGPQADPEAMLMTGMILILWAHENYVCVCVFVTIVMELFARRYLMPIMILRSNMALRSWSEMKLFRFDYLQSTKCSFSNELCQLFCKWMFWSQSLVYISL